MILLDYDRYCAEIVAQSELLRSRIDGADMTVSVPSLPMHFEVHPSMRELLDFWLERVGFG